MKYLICSFFALTFKSISFGQVNDINWGFSLGFGGSTAITLVDSDFKGGRTWLPSASLDFKGSRSINKKNRLGFGVEYSTYGDKSNLLSADPSKGIFQSHQFKTNFNSLLIPITWNYMLTKTVGFSAGVKTGAVFIGNLYLSLSDENKYIKVDSQLETKFDLRICFSFDKNFIVGSRLLQLGFQNEFTIIKNSLNLEFGNKMLKRSFYIPQVRLGFWL